MLDTIGFWKIGYGHFLPILLGSQFILSLKNIAKQKMKRLIKKSADLLQKVTSGKCDEVLFHACCEVARDWGLANRERKSIDWYERALKLGTQLFPDANEDVIGIHQKLAQLWIKLGKHRVAVQNFQVVLGGVKELFGEESLEAAASHFAIGSLFKSLVRRKPARLNLEKAESILRLKVGIDHPNYKAVQRLLETLD
jgi:hypothetical protein